MATPETIPMQVSDLESCARVLEKEVAYCELCGAPLQLWPPQRVKEHALSRHRATMWPKYVELYEKFMLEPDTPEKRASLQNQAAEYLVRVLAARFDLYQKLVAAGAIVRPSRG